MADSSHNKLKLIRLLSENRRGMMFSELETELELSRKTITRYLNELIEAGFPIHETTGDRGVKTFFLTAGWSQLDVSFDEILSLYFGRSLYESFAGTPFWKSAHSLFEKIHKIVPKDAKKALEFESRLYTTASGASDYSDVQRARTIDRLFDAVQEKKRIFAHYKSSSSKPASVSELHPLGLIFHKGSIYLLARRDDHVKPRCYKAERFDHVQKLDRAADVPDGFSCEEFMKGSFGVFTPEDNEYDVRIRFPQDLAERVLESRWHRSQTFHYLPNNDLVLCFKLNGLQEVKSWVLGWGPSAVVLSPPKLVEMIRHDLQQSLNAYNLNEVQATHAATVAAQK
jgi:predicted DNA-binding transcriptional regulator YafY